MSKLKVFNAQRMGKITLYIAADALILNFSLLAAMSLWYTGIIPGSNSTGIPESGWLWFQYMAIFGTGLQFVVFAVMGMYNNLWKYASIDEMLKIFISTTIVFLALYFYNANFLRVQIMLDASRRLIFVAWAVDTMLFAFSRFGYHTAKQIYDYIGYLMTSKAGFKRVMIVGAGFSGYGLIKGMRSSRVRESLPVIVVDDDPSKNNTRLMGVRVRCGTEDIATYAEKYMVDEIIIALPSATRTEIKDIIDRCTKTECTLKIMPPLSDVSDISGVQGKFNSALSLRKVNISDLLYREEVSLDLDNIREYLSGRTVLVTGGGGSIGSELCRQIAKFEPSSIIIFDIYENNAYQLLNELHAKYCNRVNIIIRIGSVRDEKRVDEVFEEFKPEIVFHAAAHKHVPLMESSPAEAVKNNVFGTHNVAMAADRHRVDRFVLLSTDKAVNPANVMGATKRLTELIIQSMSLTSKTKYMAVRFGNVLGSNGSVIPLFTKQIEEGGPVTVTHPDIIRYFMTIPEAARLVLQAASSGQTGRIFVLDMGSPVKIDDLARNLIKLSGLRPDKDIEIRYTGLRPGEKLYEELIMDEEKDQMQVTYHKKIFVAKPISIDYSVFSEQLRQLKSLAYEKPHEVGIFLHEMLPNYVSEGSEK